MRQYVSTSSDLLGEDEIPDYSQLESPSGARRLRVLSLFSGCGGMDLGLEGGFIAPRRSFAEGSPSVVRVLNDDWVLVRRTRMETVFANDILPEAPWRGRHIWAGLVATGAHTRKRASWTL